ncbi:TPA: hypothetical protein L4W69_005771, partial [Pseudomonas aeruginosa]|nr:hypothetical protein [Pseudomonas aeruginosa]
LILTEADWAQKYANASSRKLIKYKDFSNPHSAATEFHSYPGHSPKDVINGGTLLTAPQWYKTMTNWKPTGFASVADDVVYAGLGRSSPDTAANTNALGTQPPEGWRGIPHGTLRGPRTPSSLGRKLIGKDNPLSKPRHDLTETGVWPGARGTLDLNEEEAARIYMNFDSSHGVLPR